MDHSYYKDRISAYHDRDLKPEEIVVVEEHLADCAECQELLEKLEKLDRMVEEQSQLGGDQYWERSAEKIEARLGLVQTEVVRVAKERPTGAWWKWVAAAASVGALTFIALHQTEITEEAPAHKAPSPVILEKAARPEPDVPADEDLGASTSEFRAPAKDDELSDMTLEATEEKETGKVQPRGEAVDGKAKVEQPALGFPKPVPAQEADRRKSRAAADLEAAADDIADLKSAETVPVVSPEEADKYRPVKTVEELLLQVPGVQSVGDTVFVRGGGPGKEVPYIADGVPVEAFWVDKWNEQGADYWVARRDSLKQILYSEGEEPRSRVERGLRLDDNYKSDSDSVSDSTEGAARELLHACQVIAYGSSDQSQREQSIEIVEKMASDSSLAVQNQAKTVLKDLNRAKE